MNLVRKAVHIDVTYWMGRQDPSRGIFEGGAPDPEHLDELHMDVSADETFDQTAGRFVSTGKTQISLSGSCRAYREFARFLLSVAEYCAGPDTLDPDPHTHFDGITSAAGEPSVHLIVRGCRPAPDS